MKYIKPELTIEKILLPEIAAAGLTDWLESSEEKDAVVTYFYVTSV